ncbi:unnamed protein product, partial [Heterotrigona itama]
YAFPSWKNVSIHSTPEGSSVQDTVLYIQFAHSEIFSKNVRTPGGKLVYQYLKKPKKIPRCGQCKDKLRGIQPARPMERSRMCRRKKTVKRVYGGVLCHKCVKE